MQVGREYRETVGYGWLLLRQADRFFAALSSIEPEAANPGLRRAWAALAGLLVAASPVVETGDLEEQLWAIRALIARGGSGEAFRLLLRVAGEILSRLDRAGLLLRADRVLLGRAEVGADAYPE